MSKWKWVRHEGRQLHDVGILPDGSLHNPNGYPEGEVRTAVAAAEERRHLRRSKAAKTAAATRKTRQEKQVYRVVQRIIEGNPVGPKSHCALCGRELSDPPSINRGIGSECWDRVLAAIEARAA
jgi:uncharacterized protein DUF6011